MYIVILSPEHLEAFLKQGTIKYLRVVFKHECVSCCRAVYLDIGAESYTSTARPLRFAVTSSLLPEFPPKSAQQQVVESASVAFALKVIQQQGSAARVNGGDSQQESPTAKPIAQGWGPWRRPQWHCHGLAPLHRVALSQLARLGSSLQNPQDARSHMTASTKRQRQRVLIHPEGERKP